MTRNRRSWQDPSLQQTTRLVPIDRLGGARNILAIRLDTIGDVVMTAPALSALSADGARVTLLTSTAAAPLAPLLSGVHDVVALDVPWMKLAEKDRPPAASHRSAVERLRDRNFDGAVIFTVSTQDPSCAAYLAYQCDIPRVAAYQARTKLYGLVSDAVPDTEVWPPRQHEVERQLDLVRSLGFTPMDGETGIATTAQSSRVARLIESLNGRPWCLVHPGASARSRRYPAAMWAQVADRLAQAGVRAVIAGGRFDRQLIREMVRCCDSTPLRVDGRFDLPELAQLVKRAPVALTCNSAAAHLAAGLGTRVVTLYSGTNPQHTPYTSDSVVLRAETECAWCLSSICPHGDPLCLTLIPPARVANAALAFLQPYLPSSAAV